MSYYGFLGLDSARPTKIFIPAKAGIQDSALGVNYETFWIPAYAGTAFLVRWQNLLPHFSWQCEESVFFDSVHVGDTYFAVCECFNFFDYFLNQNFWSRSARC